MVHLVTTLNNTADRLEGTLTKAGTILKGNRSVEVNELLQYAQRVATHTLAPLEPPIPQENHIRASLLFQQNKGVDTQTRTVL
jgi:hypothetical protein